MSKKSIVAVLLMAMFLVSFATSASAVTTSVTADNYSKKFERISNMQKVEEKVLITPIQEEVSVSPRVEEPVLQASSISWWWR
ncbi:hypothetical protein ABFV99_13580 [Cytobacillus horneckiae]|uniref:hypothetical protein n=1 Tax=Cytobacillus horneckiae TaxID=549687 RepID=UPI0034CD6C5C